MSDDNPQAETVLTEWQETVKRACEQNASIHMTLKKGRKR